MSKFQVGDMLRFEQHRNESYRFLEKKIKHCIVVKIYDEYGGEVYWFQGTHMNFVQPVDWDRNFFGEYVRVA